MYEKVSKQFPRKYIHRRGSLFTVTNLKIRVWVDANKLSRLCLWGTRSFRSQHHRCSTQMSERFSCCSWPARQLLNSTINNLWLREIKSVFRCQQNGKPTTRIRERGAAFNKRMCRREGRSESCTHSYVGVCKFGPAEDVNESVEAGQLAAGVLLPFGEGRRLNAVQVVDWSHHPEAWHRETKHQKTVARDTVGRLMAENSALFPIGPPFSKVLLTLCFPHNQSWVLHRGIKLQSVESQVLKHEKNDNRPNTWQLQFVSQAQNWKQSMWRVSTVF